MADDTTDHVVPLEVLLVCHVTNSPIDRKEVVLDIADVEHPILTSAVHLIGVVGVTRLWSNTEADDIFIVSVGLHAVFAFVEVLICGFDFLVGFGGAFFGVVVALQVTILCKHEMCL